MITLYPSYRNIFVAKTGDTMTGNLTVPKVILSSGIIYPASDSPTAIQINKADGTTNVLNVDTSNSRVGIGTDSPNLPLHIYANTDGITGFRVQQAGADTSSQVQSVLQNNAGSLAYYGLTASTYTTAPVIANRAFFGSFGVDTLIWTQSENNIIFATNGITTASERMRIDSTGRVGIGTVSPNANAILDVDSTTKAFMPPRMTTTQRDAISTPTEGMIVYNLTTHNLDFYNGSAWGAV